MSSTVSIEEAQSHLTELTETLAPGEELVITQDNARAYPRHCEGGFSISPILFYHNTKGSSSAWKDHRSLRSSARSSNSAAIPG
jgi:hypothetical protein